MGGNISYIKGDESLIDEIRELWERLNMLHADKSPYFKNHYLNFTYQSRKKALLSCAEKGLLLIVIAYNDDAKVGYCVASVDNGVGEIDSVYVRPDYRKAYIGKTLIETSLDWIKSNGAEKITVKVAFGNEEVFGFYSKFGFAPRFTELHMTE